MNSADKPAKKRKAPRKHNARIAAVQALYQMEITNRGATGVIEEFLEHRLHQTEAFDQTLFARLVGQVVEHQDQIDEAIRARLSGSWRLSRLDTTLRALLRCGCCELLIAPDTPVAVVLDEYVQIAKAFFDPKESGFVNATLDGIAKTLSASKAVK